MEDEVEVQLLTAARLHNVPVRRTDVTESAWIARLVEHDLARASLRATAPIRRRRGLTRYRAALSGERTERSSGSGEKQWIEKLLEDTGIKLSVFVSDRLGVSGRAMLSVGQFRPQALSTDTLLT